MPEEVVLIVSAVMLQYPWWVAALFVFTGLRNFCGDFSLAIIALIFSILHLGVSGLDEHSSLAILSAGSFWPILFFMILQAFQGLFFSIPLAIAFESFSVGARLIDTLRGAQYAEQISPLTESRSSLLEVASNYVVAGLFFLGAGYEVFFKAAITAHGAVVGFLPGILEGERIMAIVRLSANTINEGVCMALPVLFVLLLFDLSSFVYSRYLGGALSQTELACCRLILGLFVLMCSSDMLLYRGVSLVQSSLSLR